MPQGKLRAAIIGCGVIANAHAKAIAANEDLVELYAVCDILPDRAEEYRRTYGARKAYVDYQEMLKDPMVDMVSICTPSGLHAEHAIACAKHGKHVLCEKPLDITPERLTAMVSAFGEGPLKAGAVFQYRTYPGIRQAKALLDAGTLGKVLVANAHYQQYRSPEYYRSAGWRGTWAMDGGGATMNQGIHILDILCYLGGGARSVMAKTLTRARAIEVEDVSSAVIVFQNGAVGAYQATTLVTPPLNIHAEVFCEKGRIAFTDPSVTLYTEEHPGGIPLGEPAVESATGAANPAAISRAGHDFLLRNLARAIRGEEEVFVPFAKARHAVDVILALYESNRTGAEVILRP